MKATFDDSDDDDSYSGSTSTTAKQQSSETMANATIKTAATSDSQDEYIDDYRVRDVLSYIDFRETNINDNDDELSRNHGR